MLHAERVALFDTFNHQIKVNYREALACFERLQLAAAGDIACAALQEVSAFISTYGWPVQQIPQSPPRFDPDAALTLLFHTLSHLAEQNLVAFASGGTLLGLTREGRLLPDSKVLNIGTPIAHVTPVISALAAQGWELSCQPSRIPLHASNCKNFVHRASGIRLDLMASDFDPVRGKVVGGWWPQGMQREAGRLLAFSPFPLELRRVGETDEWKHWVITQPDTLLTELYGPTWRISDPGWMGLFETPALVDHTPYSHVLGYLRLLELWLGGHPQRFQRLAEVLRRLDPADRGLPQLSAIRVSTVKLNTVNVYRSGTALVARHDAGKVTAGLRQSLQNFTDNRIAPALATARQTLLLAASMPLPAHVPSQITPIDTTVAYPLLQQTLSALTCQGIQGFAFGGVLLGLVREGRLLPHDKDIDVVVPWPQFAAAGQHLLLRGWQSARTTVHADNFRCFIHPPSGITLDLFGYDFQSEVIYGGWWPTGLARTAGRLLRFSLFALQQVDSPYGMHWAITRPEPVLTELYGSGWRVADPSFDATLETPALVAYTDYTRCWGMLRLLEAWTHGHRAACLRRLSTLARRDPGDALLADWHHRLDSEIQPEPPKETLC